MDTIKDILIKRDGLTSSEANHEINQAKLRWAHYMDIGAWDLAENICQEFFNLEPDYIYEILN